VARADRVVELDSQNVLFGTGVLLGEERQVVLFGVSGLIELVGALFDDFEGGLGSQIEVEVRIVAVEVEVVVFAVGSLVEAELRFERQCRPLVDVVRVGSRFGQAAAVDGVVDVFEHLGQDQFARVAGLVEQLVG